MLISSYRNITTSKVLKFMFILGRRAEKCKSIVHPASEFLYYDIILSAVLRKHANFRGCSLINRVCLLDSWNVKQWRCNLRLIRCVVVLNEAHYRPGNSCCSNTMLAEQRKMARCLLDGKERLSGRWTHVFVVGHYRTMHWNALLATKEEKRRSGWWVVRILTNAEKQFPAISIPFHYISRNVLADLYLLC